MGQESKCESEIKKFVVEEFGIKFPMFSKIEVNGKDTHAVFAYLKANTPSLNKGNNVLVNIPWNFSKFLVDSNGKVVKYFGPKEKPEKLVEEVKQMLLI